MKKNLFLLMVALTSIASNEILAQNGTPYWSMSGNSNAPANPAILGTTTATSLSIRTSGLERIRVTDGGNIGIGIVTSSSKLAVNAPTGASPFRVYVNNGTKLMVHANGGVSVGSSTAPAVSNGLFVNGFVGLGTSTPAERLHVVGNQTLDGNLKFVSDQQSIQFANPAGTPAPMMYMLASGTTNTNRMVLAHSPAFPNWGLQYIDGTDQFNFIGSGSSKMSINLSSGNVGIGTINPSYKLSVNGAIQAKEVRVETGWADYVFENNYPLRPLAEVEQFVQKNKHLPGIASAKEIQENGLQVGAMQTKMMEKIEELTLYVIALQKQVDQLQKKQQKGHK
ncbi:hypothetical protein SAMN05444008_11684 [Cnuella takakiae]|uniref:Uncharacterized protein n=2 Tax=Cnuella takakiae TaxID=1302690 RepID=A0A1M5GHQ2_9BACT|nr:hypothetical protein BUE76_11385 [Cnuella takakiae]SHG03216.1 hypothetical protein SAMN05444008_11684 [Cnuella takakiae]